MKFTKSNNMHSRSDEWYLKLRAILFCDSIWQSVPKLLHVCAEYVPHLASNFWSIDVFGVDNVFGFYLVRKVAAPATATNVFSQDERALKVTMLLFRARPVIES